MENRVSTEVGLQLYELMVRIRKFEEAVVQLFAGVRYPVFCTPTSARKLWRLAFAPT